MGKQKKLQKKFMKEKERLVRREPLLFFHFEKILSLFCYEYDGIFSVTNLFTGDNANEFY